MWGWIILALIVGWVVGFSQAALHMRDKILLGRFELNGKIYRVEEDK